VDSGVDIDKLLWREVKRIKTPRQYGRNVFQTCYSALIKDKWAPKRRTTSAVRSGGAWISPEPRTVAPECEGLLPTTSDHHARYTREEIVAALDSVAIDGGKPNSLSEGVPFTRAAKSDAFLVTLQKSGVERSPRRCIRTTPSARRSSLGVTVGDLCGIEDWTAQPQSSEVEQPCRQPTSRSRATFADWSNAVACLSGGRIKAPHFAHKGYYVRTPTIVVGTAPTSGSSANCSSGGQRPGSCARE
jgi:hypothetical protein